MDCSDMQEFSKEERLQFDELKKRIEDAAFKKDKNYSTYKQIKVFNRDDFKTTQILKNGDINRGIKIIPPVKIQRSRIENLDEIVESFISELTLEIWLFKNYGNIDNAKKQLHEINEGHINKVKEFLKHMGFRRKARKETIQTLENDLIDREKQILGSQDFKYFFKIDPESRAWKHRENEVITKIKSLYKNPLEQNNGSLKTISLLKSDRKIISNMAYIFAEIDFWDDKPTNREIAEDMKSLNSISEKLLNKLKNEKRLELYFDRIKKRLQKDKELNEIIRIENKPHKLHQSIEISPPIKNPNKANFNFLFKFCKQLLLKFWNFINR
jgi:tRNA U34 5-carboxymethylaminomethyl modifying GTPase MnmE/TrmE